MAGKIPDSFSEGRKPFPTEDLGNQSKIQGMLFPGSTISHTLIKPNEGQKKVMEEKYAGTSEWNWNDPAARQAAFEYDNHPDVVKRRWDAMGWDAKIMNIDKAVNRNVFIGWNMALSLLITRSYFTSLKGSLLPWGTLWFGVLYLDWAPEQK